jgi:hypothetical protein
MDNDLPAAVFLMRQWSAQCAPKLHIQYMMGTVGLSLTTGLREAKGNAIGLSGAP